MQNYSEIIFYNHCHNGDIHLSRTFVRDIIKKTEDKLHCYEHLNCSSILSDIDRLSYRKLNQHSLDTKVDIIYHDNKCYINTWVATKDFKYYTIGGGCTLSSLYAKFIDIYSELNIKIEEPSFYMPIIDFSKISNINLIESLITTNYDNNVFISNGNVNSGQATNFDFNSIIERLAILYPEKNYFLTAKNNFLVNLNLKNLIFTSDLTNVPHSDLCHNSFISTKCKYIIGRASGPYEFSKVKENLLDYNKKYICFSKNQREGEWKENYIFCSSYNYFDENIDAVFAIIRDHLKD